MHYKFILLDKLNNKKLISSVCHFNKHRKIIQQNPTLFLAKIPSKVEIKGNVLNLMKGIFENP